MTGLMISTDLDGTLLDHHNYSPAPADRLFAQLDRLQIPWIFNTSKTCAEVLLLREQLHNQHPFVVENGSALYIPEHLPLPACSTLPHNAGFFKKQLGTQRSELLRTLTPLRSDFAFESFSQMHIARVMTLTGLNEPQAQQALQREYSEPILWLDCPAALLNFTQYLEKQGLRVLRGGRFVHLMGDTDKAVAQRWLADQFAALWQLPTEVIALGDSDNDNTMLATADIAVQVRSPVHSFPKLPQHKRLIQTQAPGPAGWYEAISQLLSERFALSH